MDCLPNTEVGAQYVQEVIAPSGPTCCDGPPDGSDISAATAKTRDQVVVARPSWISGTWDFVIFLTPYYAQQVVAVSYPVGNDPAVVRNYVRWVVNSIPTSNWWDLQLPNWHNPSDYTIFDDEGTVVEIPIAMAVGFSCPRILRSLFVQLSLDAPITSMVREVRRWGRYMTIAPVANATQLKGRLVSSSLQFNSALNPLHFELPVLDLGVDPDLDGFSIFNPSWTAVSNIGTYFDGIRSITFQSLGQPSTFTSSIFPFGIYNTSGGLLALPNTVIEVQLIWPLAGVVQMIWRIDGNVIMTNTSSSPVSFDVRVRTSAVADTTTVSLDELARYSITPDFSFSALQQADDKSFTTNFIEGVFSRQAYGKDHLDYTSTREWRPLIRAPPNKKVVVVPEAIKRDLVDLSGKWHITYATNIDPSASFALVYGTHYQFCSETDQLFQLFKRPPCDLDEGALSLANLLQVKLPHSYPAKFNDGGILPSLLTKVVSIGKKALPGIVNFLTNSVSEAVKSVGTSDRLIGYPNQVTMYGGNAPIVAYPNGSKSSRRKKKSNNGNGNTLRNMALARSRSVANRSLALC